MSRELAVDSDGINRRGAESKTPMLTVWELSDSYRMCVDGIVLPGRQSKRVRSPGLGITCASISKLCRFSWMQLSRAIFSTTLLNKKDFLTM